MDWCLFPHKLFILFERVIIYWLEICMMICIIFVLFLFCYFDCSQVLSFAEWLAILPHDCFGKFAWMCFRKLVFFAIMSVSLVQIGEYDSESGMMSLWHRRLVGSHGFLSRCVPLSHQATAAEPQAQPAAAWAPAEQVGQGAPPRPLAPLHQMPRLRRALAWPPKLQL